MKFVSLLTLALVATIPATVALAQDEPVDIKGGTAVVDGKLDEFIAAKALVCHVFGPDYLGTTTGIDDAKDQSADIYALYDSKNFYLAADVTDDAVVNERSGGSIWENDALEVWLDGKQFGIAIDADEGQPFVQDWMGVGSATKAAFVKTAKGWIAEASISLAELRDAGVDITKGKSIQIALGTDDSDDGAFGGHLYFPTSWAWGNPASFATATFK